MKPREKGAAKAEAEIDAMVAKHKAAGKTVTGALIDAEVWRDFRIHCISNDLPVGDTLTEAIREFLQKDR